MRPLRVFLCHSSKDKAAVRELYQKLRAEEWIDPWLDEEKLLPGQDWHEEIEKAVEITDVVIVLLSKQSVSQEGFVQRELKLALDVADEKPENTIFIIPLRLDDCPAPRRLRGWHYVDYFPESQKPWVMKRLIASLKLRAETLGIKTAIREEPRKETPAPSQEGEEPEGKFTQQKPFTKLLDPSSLIPKETSRPREKVIQEREGKRIGAQEAEERIAREEEEIYRQYSDKKSARIRRRLVEQAVKAKRSEEFVERVFNFFSSHSRQFSLGGIVLLVLIFGGFGLNYLIKNPPVATATLPLTKTATPTPPTFTSVPFTQTLTPTKPLVSTSTKTLSPIPALGIGSTIVSEKDGMTLLYVPAGEFTMGSDNGSGDEQPAHQVYLDTFWIDQTEVTNAMYANCVSAGACSPPSSTRSYTRDSYYGTSKFDNYPVVYVSWHHASAYCAWAGRRLPTEAEWEKSARGTDARTYPWGNEIPNANLLNYFSNVGETTEVGKYPNGASIYGALDMAGNVWEWVNDWYSKTYYANSPYLNPLGPDAGMSRVLRGGSWSYDNYGVRTANRGEDNPTSTYVGFGFRCARSP
jgi:formylglycine-generating enzyme required for sulfatase activity